MAYRRAIITRASLVTRHRVSPLPYIPSLSSDDNEKHSQVPLPLFFNAVNSPLGHNISPFGSFAYRNMSTEVNRGDKIMSDVADVWTDGVADVAAATGPTMSDMTIGAADVAAAAVPAVNEVAIAAADSAFPVAALQYVIDGVHNATGFNWWASIALTTLLIRGATVPLLINQLKSTTKLSLMRPKLEEIKDEMQEKDMDPKAVAEGQQRMQALFKEYGVNPLTPLKGLLFQGPIFLSFFLAISNMVEKVPSFKQGGAFWFTDLTTPDSLYIFPSLAALSFWITVEFNMQEGMEGNPAANTMKKVMRVFAALTIPLTMGFPKALFCYWVTSNMFSLMYGFVLKLPGVKPFLNIPDIPVTPISTTNPAKPEFSFLDSMKKYVAAQKYIQAQHSVTSPQQATTSSPAETPKSAGFEKTPSAAILSERIKRLERQVKGKKNKKP